MARQLHHTAYEIRPGEKYVPYVQSDHENEATLRAVLTGVVLGIVFGVANTYLGLMSGFTISTSIPVAVLSIVVFRTLRKVSSQHSILEANLSQTIGSASSSLASGVLFTIPALFLWGMAPSLLQLTFLAMAGGLIGVVAMVPLRRYLIKQEHGKLPYPEGMACAEVLVAAEGKSRSALNVFWGLGVGAAFKLVTDGINLIVKTFQINVGELIHSLTNFQLGLAYKFNISANISPALMGVGYILGLRIASVIFFGSLIASFILIPGLALWGANLTAPVYPEQVLLLSDMSAAQIWDKYIRYIGAGAVATAGIITLIKSIPVMIDSFRLGLQHFGHETSERFINRLDRDLRIKVLFAILAIVAAILIVVPGILGFLDSIYVRLLATVLIVIFAFFFVTVSARIVGLIGVTSNPTSGMMIVTLLITTLIFYFLGWTDLAGKATALMVGTVVAIAASIAGDTSQDLKTGFLLGATPKIQQMGEILGVFTAAFFVAWTVTLLHQTIGIGTEELPAPQAVLVHLLIDGVMDRSLPWNLIFIGVGLTLLANYMKFAILPFAVGIYLPLSSTAAIFLGGLLYYLVTSKKEKSIRSKLHERGVLFSSGLVGGEGLMGVGIALYVLITGSRFSGLSLGLPQWATMLVSLLALLSVLWFISQAAKGKLVKDRS